MASIIANCHRDDDVRSEPFRPGDFVIDYPYEPPLELTEEELAAKLDGVFGALAKRNAEC